MISFGRPGKILRTRIVGWVNSSGSCLKSSIKSAENVSDSTGFGFVCMLEAELQLPRPSRVRSSITTRYVSFNSSLEIVSSRLESLLRVIRRKLSFSGNLRLKLLRLPVACTASTNKATEEGKANEILCQNPSHAT